MNHKHKVIMKLNHVKLTSHYNITIIRTKRERACVHNLFASEYCRAINGKLLKARD